ncbi:MAG: hypothetical protein C4521_10960 [Actinobacteria bacterium]|nr:MAG: hypothetical protein C4521_10960 [Actinomycetota bacterium]
MAERDKRTCRVIAGVALTLATLAAMPPSSRHASVRAQPGAVAAPIEPLAVARIQDVTTEPLSPAGAGSSEVVARAVVPTASETDALVRRLRSLLAQYSKEGWLSAEQAAEYRTVLDKTDRSLRRLMELRQSWPAGELFRVLSTTEAMIGRARIRPLMAILRANAEYFETTSTLPPKDAARAFDFSTLNFYYTPGFGLQLRPSASLHEALLALEAGREETFVAQALELDSYVVRRSSPSYPTLEYYFPYLSRPAGWYSPLPQSRLMVAYMRLSGLTGEDAWATKAEAALAGLTRPIGRGGMRDVLSDGSSWYPMYPFAPQHRILNGQLSVLLNLWDVAGLPPSDGAGQHALGAFTSGDRGIRGILPAFDSGRWSRYSLRGRDAWLDYHRFHVTALSLLAGLTGYQPYADYSRLFMDYEKWPSRLALTAPRPQLVSPNGDRRRDTAVFQMHADKPQKVNLELTTGDTTVVARLATLLRIDSGPSRMVLPSVIGNGRLADGQYEVRATSVEPVEETVSPSAVVATQTVYINLSRPRVDGYRLRTYRASLYGSFRISGERGESLRWGAEIARGGKTIHRFRPSSFAKARRITWRIELSALRRMLKRGPGAGGPAVLRVYVEDRAANRGYASTLLPLR